MKEYLLKSLSYALYLLVIFVVVYTVMALTNTTTIRPEQLGAFFDSRNGYMVIGVLILISLGYPKFGFTTKELVGVTYNKEKIISVCDMLGFAVVDQDESSVVFRAKSHLKKTRMLYNDKITISHQADAIMISGHRGAVVSISLRIDAELKNN